MDLCSGCAAALPYIADDDGSSCAVCALPLPRGIAGQRNVVCGRCLRNRPRFDRVRAVFRYQAPVDQLILGLKFNGRLSHARLLGRLCGDYLNACDFERPDVLMPVPLHRRRLRERGFNQSLELARHMGRALNLSIWPHACFRQRDTVPQSGLPARQRHHNVRDAFVVERDCSGIHIALVDDVLTTGSTANEMARALSRAGATRVEVWVCARASG